MVLLFIVPRRRISSYAAHAIDSKVLSRALREIVLIIPQRPIVIDHEVGLIHYYVLPHGLRLQHLVALPTAENLALQILPDILRKQELLLLCHLLIIHVIFKARMLCILILLIIHDLNLVALSSKDVISFLLGFQLGLSFKLELIESFLLDEVDVIIQILRNEYLRQIAYQICIYSDHLDQICMA